jgi:serine/threonine protein kinase
LRQPIPFGKYYLLERINVGGMAEVFKAKATGVEGFERMVAVKRILPSIAEDEEFITMFIDEAKIAVQLTHANVAQIFDLGKVDDSYFIALEYVHGKDLRAIFNRARARGEQLPIPMACYVIMKQCEGLDYAHNKRDAGGQFLNLVHRDVSPQNILVSYEGEVKIIDFGIAKAAGKAGRTQAGILKGKFGYMSPEQVQGFEIDRRSDVFGVGICLYELLTGERLFVGESDFATLEKVRNVDIMPPSTYNRRIPEELEQIVLKALARDREDRHQTAMQLHDELQGFMYGSGNFFGRRDLSMYMHRAFGEEIERESARDQEYAAMSMPEGHDEITGLTAFDEIDPVSTVSALNVQPAAAPRPPSGSYAPYPPAPSAPRAASVRGMPAPQASPYGGMQQQAAPVRPHKATLLGVPTAAQPMRASTPPGLSHGTGGSRPVVPPLVPRPQSIPPSHARPGSQPPRLEMDWDDEELSTQIYDRPEEGAPAHGSGPVNPISGPYAPAAASAQAHLARGYAGAPPGAPSPFMHNTPVSGGVSTAEIAWPPGGLPQRRPMLAAAVAVVAIIAVIVGALMVFRRPASGTVHITTVPGDVAVAIDGKPVPGSSPFVANDVAPGVPHEITVSKQGYRPWSSKFELQSNETMQLPPVTLDSLESGFALDSVPSGAAVYVDGKELSGKTPVRVADLGPGDHHIRLEADGYARWESSLHVTPGTVLDLPTASLIALAPETGGKSAAKPAAVASLPTRSAESSGGAAPARSAGSSGSAERIRRPRPTRSAPPAVAESEPEPEAPSPAPAPAPAPAAAAEPADEPSEPADAAGAGEGTGTLRVQTRPWSKVFVDGRLVGNTPLMGVELAAGRHTLTFVNEDFGIRKTVKVQILAGQTLTQVLTLDQ